MFLVSLGGGKYSMAVRGELENCRHCVFLDGRMRNVAV